MFTRKEFEELRIESAKKMMKDERLHREALDVLVRADGYKWIHQSNWLGEPILNLPQDMFALQEIIFETKPKFIIELGVAWGGSLLFYSTLMEVLGEGQIIGVDIYVPDDLKERLASHGKLSERLTLISGSSIEKDTLYQVKSVVGNCREVMVILDSFHTHDHVLKELQLYSPLVGKEFYLICGDTIVESLPKPAKRPWGPGNSPKSARDTFLKQNDRFVVDERIENKLLFTCNPGGYLRAIKE
ncbi:MAG: CmcI family methyltransferase [Desulfobacterales bacterium]